MRNLAPLFLIAALLAAPASHAQSVAFGGISADISAPVEVEADNLTVNQSTGQAEFSGNVSIIQGEMRLSAQRVRVNYAAGGQQRIETLEASGDVTLVNGPEAAEAQNAVYNVASGTITLTGDVLMTQGENILAGERMEVNLRDGTAAVSGRVRSVIQPGGN
ncbi:MAG: lipopolysaccharide transport periplasmic protein LptA [Paracoccus sp. (in: a-proteobacteria)]|nr:lipopolysaccharide transport periplasmic protein LptA [Paracoccus sp. (in: a-proteobacteria)]